MGSIRGLRGGPLDSRPRMFAGGRCLLQVFLGRVGGGKWSSRSTLRPLLFFAGRGLGHRTNRGVETPWPCSRRKRDRMLTSEVAQRFSPSCERGGQKAFMSDRSLHVGRHPDPRAVGLRTKSFRPEEGQARRRMRVATGSKLPRAGE